jgi:hypothetical protein
MCWKCATSVPAGDSRAHRLPVLHHAFVQLCMSMSQWAVPQLAASAASCCSAGVHEPLRLGVMPSLCEEAVSKLGLVADV